MDEYGSAVAGSPVHIQASPSLSSSTSQSSISFGTDANLKKLEKKRAELKEIEERMKILEQRTVRLENKSVVREAELKAKLAKTKSKLALIVNKEKRVKDLVDTIRVASQQGKLELEHKRVSRTVLLRTRLVRLANMLTNLFGGMCFIAPLDTVENSALSSSAKGTGHKFFTYIWSKSALDILKQHGETAVPMLEKAPIFQYVLDSRTYYFPDLKLLVLPKNHIKLTSALLVPVVVDNKSLGLVGLANGQYTTDDALVLMESLPNSWVAIISEAVRDSSASLVNNTLPSYIVEKILGGGGSARSSSSSDSSFSGGSIMIAEKYEHVTVMFCDIVGFTKITKSLPPEQVVKFVNRFFYMIDEIVEGYPVEKIKTIGDAYMLASGIPVATRDHVETVADVALQILDELPIFNSTMGTNIHVRIGIHTGPVVAGVIGKTKLAYDVWGETVNKASRMESTGIPDRIQVSEETYHLLKGYRSYKLEPRGTVKVHGLGDCNTWLLSRNAPTDEVQISFVNNPSTSGSSNNNNSTGRSGSDSSSDRERERGVRERERERVRERGGEYGTRANNHRSLPRVSP